MNFFVFSCYRKGFRQEILNRSDEKMKIMNFVTTSEVSGLIFFNGVKTKLLNT